jgi:hypothetical protein
VTAKTKLKPGITLNFFGEGYNLLRFDETKISFAEIEARAAEMRSEVDRSILDLEFYEPFSTRGLKSWKDITVQVTRGSAVNRLSWMEIRSEGKKRKTTNLEELFLADTLFPLCDFAIADKPVVKSVTGSFYILEKEVGKIDTFFLEGSVPDLEHLHFSLERFALPGKELLLLSGVSCKGESLLRKDTDTVVSTMRMILT